LSVNFFTVPSGIVPFLVWILGWRGQAYNHHWRRFHWLECTSFCWRRLCTREFTCTVQL